MTSLSISMDACIRPWIKTPPPSLSKNPELFTHIFENPSHSQPSKLPYFWIGDGHPVHNMLLYIVQMSPFSPEICVKIVALKLLVVFFFTKMLFLTENSDFCKLRGDLDFP